MHVMATLFQAFSFMIAWRKRELVKKWRYAQEKSTYIYVEGYAPCSYSQKKLLLNKYPDFLTPCLANHIKGKCTEEERHKSDIVYEKLDQTINKNLK